MKKWLADYRVESSLRLARNLPEIKFEHHLGEYEIRICNANDSDGNSNEDLAVQTIVSAEDIATQNSWHWIHRDNFFGSSAS